MRTVHASVIIPAWNGRCYLPRCLDALLAQQGATLEVIVVDNASEDGSADLVAQRYPNVTLVRNRSNLGFAGGCNVGLCRASGEILVLLNQDTQVQAGWIEALIGALQRPQAGVVGCKVLYPDGRTIQHAGGWIEWPRGEAHHHGHAEVDEGQWDKPRQVEYVTGAALAVRRDVLEQVGLLDEVFWPGYFEDADFCFRAREVGYEVWYAPDAVLTHQETTCVTDLMLKSRMYDRGRICFALKHLHPDRFLEEYVPAEENHLLAQGSSYSVALLRTSYIEAVSLAACLLPGRWPVGVQVLDRVLDALERLARFHSASLSFAPPLQEFAFRSSMPLIGGLVASVRSLWYDVAARWAMRYLVEQQEAVNQQHDACVRSIVALARQVARLSIEARRDGEAGDPGGLVGHS